MYKVTTFLDKNFEFQYRIHVHTDVYIQMYVAIYTHVHVFHISHSNDRDSDPCQGRYTHQEGRLPHIIFSPQHHIRAVNEHYLLTMPHDCVCITATSTANSPSFHEGE